MKTHLSTEQKAELVKAAQERGLYRRENEHDACGMGFVAHIKGKQSHTIIQNALTVLDNLTHRGATGADPLTGDGAGILIQIPHEFFAHTMARQGVELPQPGSYAVGMLFMQQDDAKRQECQSVIERLIETEGQQVLGWRDVPVNPEACGWLARESMPVIRQVFIGAGGDLVQEDFERRLFVIRRRMEMECLRSGLSADGGFYVCSLSTRTVVYKGLLIAWQFPRFFADLADPRSKSAIALVHSRFSTNTFPSWPRSHPFRFIVHNGEINTLRGNVNWMHAREQQFVSSAFGDDIKKLLPINGDDGSDSEMFDNALELLTQTGRSLPHSVMMMIPEAWENHASLSAAKKAFYEYHASMMEPWDGPASIAFTDGTVVGAVLDRNGLRPSRFVVTKDDVVIMGSEVGVLEVPPEQVAFKSRLEPGRMFLVDTAEGRIVDDA